MPKRPRPGCAYQGCTKRAVPGSSYCEVHRKLVDQQYEKYGRHYDKHKRYGRNWKRIRDKYIGMHPLCEECLKQGHAVEATQVHHKVPLSEGGTNAFDNLESVCAACHNRIHNRMKKHEYKYEDK